MDIVTLNLSTLQLLAAICTSLATVVAAVAAALWLLIRPRVERAISEALERERVSWSAALAAERDARIAEIARIKESENTRKIDMLRKADEVRVESRTTRTEVRDAIEALSTRIDRVLERTANGGHR